MMKTLDIAAKDLLRSMRSISFFAFAFVVPLLVSAIFYFAFGGLASGSRGFSVAATRVLVANLDQPGAQAGSMPIGATLVGILRSPALAELVQVTESEDPKAARAAVDRQEAGVAVIIPANLTAAYQQQGQASVELYRDPTLTLGPQIVRSILTNVVEYFAGSEIASTVAVSLLNRYGAAADPEARDEITQKYAAWAEQLGRSRAVGSDPLIAIQPAAGSTEQSADLRTTIISLIMAGMMVFYVFFTGASCAQTLLQEQESGTLARVFSTATPHAAVLGGRVLATYLTLGLQIAVLVVISALAFRIHWGPPAAVVLVALGLVVLSASFGLFVTSLLRSTRQAGIIFGGVLTVLGMVGMMSVFAAGAPSANTGPFKIVALFTPHGWGVRGWQILLEGGGLRDIIPVFCVMLALAVLFFGIGLARFRRRFA